MGHPSLDGLAPAHVGEALRQRENDPARLKKEMRDVFDSFETHRLGMSPLTKLVAEQIKAALDSEDSKRCNKPSGCTGNAGSNW